VDRDLVTLREWAARHGFSYDYVMMRMRQYYQDFPAPEPGLTRSVPRRQGGTAEAALYDAAKLAPFEPRRPAPVELPDRDPGLEVTLGAFADLIGVNRKTVSQYTAKTPDDLPDTVDGARPYPRAKYRLGDLLLWWNGRPGSRLGHRKTTGRPRSEGNQ
jgi:hypothetical protein